MKATLATALALALVAGGLSLGTIPLATAGHNNCHEDFAIPDSEPLIPRILFGNNDEVGVEDVTASGGDEEVTVRLVSDTDKLEFGVFVIDPNTQNCVSASSLGWSDCGTGIVLDTTPLDVQEQERVCGIDAPNSDSRDYFFPVENLQSDSLDYKIWMSA